MNKLISWIFPVIKKDEYLNQKDIENLGFKETLTKDTIVYFKKGNMTIKWDFHVTKRIFTIKWGKSMRYFGVIETVDELERIINNINKYFGNKK